MHPVDELGQPAAVLTVTLTALAWAGILVERARSCARARRSLHVWLGQVWLDVDRLGR